jgi:hypothetical protein
LFTEKEGSVMVLIGKVAKMGNRLAQISDEAILIREPGKPTLIVFPKRREYVERLVEKKDEFDPPEELINPELLAKRTDVILKSAGVEKVDEHTCLKIEVTPKNEKYKQVKLMFWVVPSLKNLVIQVELSVGRTRHLWTLEDISLVVNEELFRVPANYKKVVEPQL